MDYILDKIDYSIVDLAVDWTESIEKFLPIFYRTNKEKIKEGSIKLLVSDERETGILLDIKTGEALIIDFRG